MYNSVKLTKLDRAYMKRLHYKQLFITVIMVAIFSTSACTGITSLTESNQPQEASSPVSTSSPSYVNPTPRPSLTATPEPVYELYDPGTWPLEMQEYFYRDPSEWSSPTGRYVTHSEFDEFLQKARFTFLEEQRITGIPPQNRSEPFYDQQLFLEYVRWGMENKQLILLSPKEIIALLADPANVGFSYGYFESETGERRSTSGLYTSSDITRTGDGLFYIHGDKRNTFTLEELLSYLDREDNPSFVIDVFGTKIEIPRENYNGVLGDLAALFYLPGIDQRDGVGLLFHFVNDAGRHCWLPLATHYITLEVAVGDLVSPCWNAQYLDVMPAAQPASVEGAHFGIPGGYSYSLLKMEDFQVLLGSMLSAYPDPYPDVQIVGPIPWQLGLESAERFYQVDEQWMRESAFPWEPVEQ